MDLAGVPECSVATDRQQCFEAVGARGGVVHNSWRVCSESAILLPGFSLLPRWFLGGVRHPRPLRCHLNPR